ncbi:hypothetical protein AUR64_08015 [Haloprofundus marisrubri]|uniref:Protein-glutamine gamma-glutamyltransferase-like C-terminal domain-containing protein n=1 Tax=Haloprofundus marisrubri TaxID=1514971 RepID=A0A0W1RB34_9EURY|nr:DUF4129 domain-containing protein [Haloprofundus marisrubri]KTG10604.1 hypothetical protein AUR64_08015 [Haloprofundus marisrubri]
MQRDTALRIGLAALAVCALALAAATLDSAVVTDDGGSFGFGPSDSGSFGGENDAPEDQPPLGGSEASAAPVISFCLPWLTQWWVVPAIVGVFLVMNAVARYRTGSYLLGLAFTVSFGSLVFVFYVLLTSCATPQQSFGFGNSNATNNSVFSGASGSSGLTGAGETITSPTLLLLVVLGVVLVGAVLLLFVSTGDDDEVVERSDDTTEPVPDVAALGEAAGRAADRIEANADTDNEVYRAWTEMTGLLDVERPQTSTPAEFAAAAEDAGMAREDVRELTDLFEQVRYGDSEVTADREERAVSALRRIESTYSEANSRIGGDDADAGRGETR